MQGYKIPLRDLQFVLHELLQTSATMQACGHEEADRETIDQVLAAAGDFAAEVIAPLNAAGDRQGCKLSAPGVVQTPPGFRDAYVQFQQNGWNGLACGEEYSGQGFPAVIGVAVNEILGGANMAWASYPGMSHASYVNIEANGSADIKALYLPKLASGEWAGTMCLTEPNAGTDLGLLRTRAVPRADGSYRITGTKIFISGGEHDLTENIVHLVLARLPDAPPGVKGISLFLVPKFIPGSGGTTGQRNAVVCGSIEEKMGIHGNSTCTMNFDGATGWMLGEPNKGLAAMFVQMNYMRIVVGMIAVGVMESAYQKSLAYANERLQGRVAGSSSGGSADAIVRHADVRRMLLMQKANVEGLRALGLWAAQLYDLQQHSNAAQRREAAELLALLTPIVKAMSSDVAVESTLTAMQVFGGHGFIRDNGVEQHVRDVRIISLYEGTNGVQSMDLLARKVLADGGQRMAGLLKQVSRFAEQHRASKQMHEFIEPLSDLVEQVSQVTASLVETSSDDPHAAGAVATAYLRLAGHLVLAWTWARAAAISLAQSSSGDGFYASKVATARFYYLRLMPQCLSLCAEIRAGTSVVMDAALELS
jgi:alkylation response protein AidB-like acyl-CoA dehydrogenase